MQDPSRQVQPTQPVKFKFVISPKPGKTPAFEIPPMLLARADEVID
jgi:hypothetical protein